jgi:alanyl-tRNA synthetase
MNPFIISALERISAAHPNGWLNGKAIFDLHDRFGLPFSIIRDECARRNAHFDESGIRGELKISYGWSPERIEAELRD